MKIIFTILLLIMSIFSYSQDFRKVVREMESKRRAENNNAQSDNENSNASKPADNAKDKAASTTTTGSNRQIVFESSGTNEYVRKDGDLINFTFNQVEITTFVKLIGDITGKKFVIDEGVEGLITVISPKIKVNDVYPLFTSILESVNCSAGCSART